MLAYHHVHVAPVHNIRMSEIVAIGTTSSGELVVATDLDYIWWNAEVAEFVARADLAAKRRTLLVSGLASDRAAAELGRLPPQRRAEVKRHSPSLHLRCVTTSRVC